MTTTDSAARDELLGRVRDGHERLMHLLSYVHAEEFVGIDVSMPQAKALYLVVAANGIHMSDLASRLRVTLSTVSGLIDRLVEAGLASRHDDPADRRQVVVTATPGGSALVERFRELNARELGSLLDILTDDELTAVADGLDALCRAAQRLEARA